MRRFLFAVLTLLPLAAQAVQPDEKLADPALEARARHLSKDLRCLVCQNQSIDDSDAPLARDLRLLVRERLTKGDSDDQAIGYIVARYGEFVLLNPRFSAQNALLWLAPGLVLLIGAGALLLRLRKRDLEPPAAPAPLTADEKAALDKLLS